MTPDHRIALLLDRLMRRFGAGIHARARDADPDRIGPLGGMILTTLADIEPTPLRDLVVLMSRDKSQMTRAIQMLESKGFVLRDPSPSDRRVTIVQLTDQGRAKVEVIRRTMAEVADEILTPLSDEARAQLTELLEELSY
ncbi:MAG: MarR family transcriptional regulator [Myxococcota bacterium]